MLTESDIEKVKSTIPTSVSYKMIANASEGEVSLSDVKRFYSLKSVPFEKAIKIIKLTKKVIADQKKLTEKVLAA